MNARDYEEVIERVRQTRGTVSIGRKYLLHEELPVNEADSAGVVTKRGSNTEGSLTLKVFRSLHGTMSNSES